MSTGELGLVASVVLASLAWFFVARRERQEKQNEQNERAMLVAEGMRYGLEYVPGEDVDSFRRLVVKARNRAMEQREHDDCSRPRRASDR